MPSLYCIKYGLVFAGLIMVGISALFSLAYSLSSFGVKQQKKECAEQNV
jgi:hypothetical protein